MGFEGLTLGPSPGAGTPSSAGGITLQGFDGVWLETVVRKFSTKQQSRHLNILLEKNDFQKSSNQF